jgi:purine-binding chemotaxis protein CheW
MERAGISGQSEAVHSPAGAEAEGRRYLALLLAGERYGSHILLVHEIRGRDRATRMPNVPRHAKGVINLRATIGTLLDLRLHFGLPLRPYDLRIRWWSSCVRTPAALADAHGHGQ